jgi:hypothetical protein
MKSAEAQLRNMSPLTHISMMSNCSQGACHMALNDDEDDKLEGNDKCSIQGSAQETRICCKLVEEWWNLGAWAGSLLKLR